MRARLLRRRRRHDVEPEPARAATRRFEHHELDIRDRDGDAERSSRASRARPDRPRRRAAVARSRRAASRSTTSTSTPSARSTCSRPRAGTRPRRRFVFMSHEQGLRRRAERASRSSSSRRAGTTPTRATATGIDETMRIDRTHAQPLRRVEGRRRRDGAGVRALLRHADRLLPRRLPHRAEPLRRRAARLPSLPRASRNSTGGTYRDLRLQGQAGPRQHPLLRRLRGDRGLLPRARAPARSTTSAAAATNSCSMLEAIRLASRS